MHSNFDFYLYHIYPVESQEKIRAAATDQLLKNAGIRTSLINWSQIQAGLRTFFQTLSLFERPLNPCSRLPACKRVNIQTLHKISALFTILDGKGPKQRVVTLQFRPLFD